MGRTEADWDDLGQGERQMGALERQLRKRIAELEAELGHVKAYAKHRYSEGHEAAAIEFTCVVQDLQDKNERLRVALRMLASDLDLWIRIANEQPDAVWPQALAEIERIRERRELADLGESDDQS